MWIVKVISNRHFLLWGAIANAAIAGMGWGSGGGFMTIWATMRSCARGNYRRAPPECPKRGVDSRLGNRVDLRGVQKEVVLNTEDPCLSDE